MATRTSIATDNFNRASLGANWGDLIPGSGGMAIVSSTMVYAVGAQGGARWIGTGTFTDDQYASIVIKGVPTYGSAYWIGVICRASADQDAARDYYYAIHTGDAPQQTILGKYVNGANTVLHSSSTPTFNYSTDTLDLECEGTTIRVCKNGTALGGSYTQTDSSLTTGAPGIVGGGGQNDVIGDDWVGGNLSAGTTPKTFTGTDSLAGGELL